MSQPILYTLHEIKGGNSALRIHIEIVHENKKSWKCGKCDSAFSLKSGLHRHEIMVHQKAKPFICSHCERAFSDKVTMNKHIAGDLYLISKKESSIEIFFQNLIIWRQFLVWKNWRN